MGAGYSGTLNALLNETTERILGRLADAAAKAGYARHWHTQTVAWNEQLKLLNVMARELIRRCEAAKEWYCILEYQIPRRQRRMDTVILAGGAIIVLEFKVGASSFPIGSIWQAEDYALDLRDFHLASRGRPIFAAVVATEAASDPPPVESLLASTDLVAPVAKLGPNGLSEFVLLAAGTAGSRGAQPVCAMEWINSEYRPLPNIIEAAEAIFQGHEVREIAHAQSENLTSTMQTVLAAVSTAQAQRRRLACFITGVPGAGKTLAGLALAHSPALREEERPPTIFLSGNGPLVHVVREALARDLRTREAAPRDVIRRVSTLVQNVHEFLNEYSIQSPHRAPPEHVVIFDEAQRAWNADQMGRKRGIKNSEPHLMLNVMERCSDWCVLIALIGGGQEIHRGEAGLAEWGRALAVRGDSWTILASPDAIAGGPSVAGNSLFQSKAPPQISIRTEPSLHLSVSLRSFRARVVTEWVNAVLAGESGGARELLNSAKEFPVLLTRSLSDARTWLRQRANGADRSGTCGLIASSGALRLRADGLELSSGFRQSFPFPEWFLATPMDVRSSNSLEVAATEFECQGLEIEWAGLCWGNDLIWQQQARCWAFRSFAGSRWRSVADPTTRQYLLNKYRVLLTRARRGMLIWVPRGDPVDQTREPVGFDETAQYLRSCGVPELKFEPIA